MTARFYFRNSEGDVTEIVDRIERMGWTLTQQAEEGTAGMSSLVIDDPGMDFDIDGHRYFVVVEDESEATDNVLFGGYTHEQETGRSGSDSLIPLGRVWTVGVSDMNAIWQRRVMIGADCNRPAETDVERMQWLLATAEAGPIDNITDFVSTADPISMDAADYRGQMFNQVADDCAQASGKNWYLWEREIGSGRETVAWYGRDTLAVYDSPLSLSNDPANWDDDALEDGTSLVWPISMDTTLRRDPTRVYSGVYLPYDGGAVYRQDAATAAQFASRDFVAPSENVKSSAKAIARALRYLDELNEQDQVIHTTVELPAGKATMLRAGMRIPFRATHLPGFSTAEVYQWCRVLSCSITPVAAGERYRLTLELVPTGTQLIPVPLVKWIHYTEYSGDHGGNIGGTISVDASDNGTDWIEILDEATLIAGTTDPPNMGAGTYTDIVGISEEHWSHRYWRLKFYRGDFPGGYQGGMDIKAFRLLSGSDWDAVDRLGTPSVGLSAWWLMSDPPFTGDIPYTGVCTGLSILKDPNDPGVGHASAGGRQGQGGMGLQSSVAGPAAITAVWTFDLLEGA